MEVLQDPWVTQTFLSINGTVKEDSKGKARGRYKVVPKWRGRDLWAPIHLEFCECYESSKEEPDGVRRLENYWTESVLLSSLSRSSITYVHRNFPSLFPANVENKLSSFEGQSPQLDCSSRQSYLCVFAHTIFPDELISRFSIYSNLMSFQARVSQTILAYPQTPFLGILISYHPCHPSHHSIPLWILPLPEFYFLPQLLDYKFLWVENSIYFSYILQSASLESKSDYWLFVACLNISMATLI